MDAIRKVNKSWQSKPTSEGAGVRLRRAFGFNEVPLFDPFLLLDDFRSDHPNQFIAGFPWHPHRGIETITYILEGKVEHADSLGNQGVIGPGDVQWMTAGSGIIHQEMPKGDSNGHMGGFQLWANLPAKNKMMDPRYRDISSNQIPTVTTPDGVEIRIICGELDGVKGPAQDIIIEPTYMDITIPANKEYTHPTEPGHTVFAYIITGDISFDSAKQYYSEHEIVLFSDGERLQALAGVNGARMLLIAGKPLGEPVSWYGPMVMNTQEEIHAALTEYRNGTFIKK